MSRKSEYLRTSYVQGPSCGCRALSRPLIVVLFGNIIDGVEGGGAIARACVRAREGEMDINTRSDIAIVWAETEKGERV